MIAIPLKYDNASNFSEGLAAVKADTSWGYIDQANKTKIPFTYSSALDFIQGQAIVSQNRKTFYIDPNGKFLKDLVVENNPMNKKGKRIQ
jgi:hypothetical protein